jgi:hypothetical protein
LKRITILAATALLSWGTPALGGPTRDPSDCGDGVPDAIDNCIYACNPAQDDTDADDCGNLCDADYDQTGLVDFADFGAFATCFGLTGCAEQQHVEPISDAMTVDFGDFGFFASVFGAGPPGPSGTTIGTIACP